jgi:hypothetical protein
VVPPAISCAGVDLRMPSVLCSTKSSGSPVDPLTPSNSLKPPTIRPPSHGAESPQSSSMLHR